MLVQILLTPRICLEQYSICSQKKHVYCCCWAVFHLQSEEACLLLLLGERSVRHPVVSKSLSPHVTPWSPPGSSVYGKNTGMGVSSLLQGIFSTQGSHRFFAKWVIREALLLGEIFHKCQFSPVGWQWCSVLFTCNFFSLPVLSDTERGVSTCHYRTIFFSFSSDGCCFVYCEALSLVCIYLGLLGLLGKLTFLSLCHVLLYP